jgi:hypothetical protein
MLEMMIAGNVRHDHKGSAKRTSFLNICSSLLPSTNHLFDHKKLRSPSSLTLAGPVLTTPLEFPLPLAPLFDRCGPSADEGFKMGNEDE